MNISRLVFASHNRHKIAEVAAILGPRFSILGLADLRCERDIPEPFRTLEENALAKARFVVQNYGLDCFADDTGLEADALNGLPGVLSARYAGHAKDNKANVKKLLDDLSEQENRKARFRTVIALIMNGKEYLFEGTVYGEIIDKPRGEQGFGYDPVFIPEGHSRTFAEMPAPEKNRISHRKIAITKLAEFLAQVSATR